MSDTHPGRQAFEAATPEGNWDALSATEQKRWTVTAMAQPGFRRRHKHWTPEPEGITVGAGELAAEAETETEIPVRVSETMPEELAAEAEIPERVSMFGLLGAQVRTVTDAGIVQGNDADAEDAPEEPESIEPVDETEPANGTSER